MSYNYHSVPQTFSYDSKDCIIEMNNERAPLNTGYGFNLITIVTIFTWILSRFKFIFAVIFGLAFAFGICLAFHGFFQIIKIQVPLYCWLVVSTLQNRQQCGKKDHWSVLLSSDSQIIVFALYLAFVATVKVFGDDIRQDFRESTPACIVFPHHYFSWRISRLQEQSSSSAINSDPSQESTQDIQSSEVEDSSGDETAALPAEASLVEPLVDANASI